MQIDFHHAVTYVVARLAGFDTDKANIIAHSAQYVDDATNDGLVRFKNRAVYQRIASAHKMLDYRNFDELSNHFAWIPFHFLPGNAGLPAGQNPQGSFIEKIICRPNSYVARDMIAECIMRKDKPYAYHLLGITAHVYVDTWAHQGFAGVIHKVNRIQKIMDKNDDVDMDIIDRLRAYFKGKVDRFSGRFASNNLPLGHGAALSYPDLPYLNWSYIDGLGRKVERDNPADFLQAADELCRLFQCFLIGDARANVQGLPAADKQTIDRFFRTFKDDDYDRRHRRWTRAIGRGEFSFGAEKLQYIAKGKGSWKFHALGTVREKDRKNEKFEYKPAFLNSDWKMFHDALQMHRHYVIRDILPKYGICAA